MLSVLVPVLPAGATDPLPVCTLHVPTVVAARAPLTWVTASFTGCDGYAEVSWTVSHGDQTYGRVTVKNGVSQGSWIYHDSWPTGTYTFAGSDASSAPQNTVRTVVKYGSQISLKSTRAGDLKVPLTGVVSRYVASANAFQRWANRPIAVSYKNCPTCTWHFLVMDRTDAHGVYSLGAVSYQPRYYRARVGDTSTVWGRTSASTYN